LAAAIAATSPAKPCSAAGRGYRLRPGFQLE